MREPSDSTAYAGFWSRVAAYFVDTAIIMLIGLVFAVGAAMAGELAMTIASVAYLVVNLAYWPVLESSAAQATYGKRLMGIRVEHADGGRTSFLRALGRNLAKLISAIPLGIGFLMAAFTGRKQAMHDLIARCVVVRTGPSSLAKALLATILALAVAGGGAAAYVHYVYVPGLKKGFDSGMRDMMKMAPPAQKPAAGKPAPGASPAPATAAARPSTPSAAPMASAADFDRHAGAPLTGLDKPNTTRAGPAILELSTFFGSNFWIKVLLPEIRNLDVAPSPEVTVNRVLDGAGRNVYDAASTFEKQDFFKRANLTPAARPVPHLTGTRNVHVIANTTEVAVQRVEGQLRVSIPVNVQVAAFAAKEVGATKTVHDATLTLSSVAGNDVVMHYRGPSRQLLTLRGFDGSGKAVAAESRQVLAQNQDVDRAFMTRFRAPVARLEAVLAASVATRDFPFVLVRGQSAGPPSAASATKSLAAPATKAVAAPTTTLAEPRPREPFIPPSREQRPAQRPAAAARAPSAPAAAPPPDVPRCVIKPAMTQAEIDACRPR